MRCSRRRRNLDSFSQPGLGSLIIFCSEESRAESELSPGILRPQLQIFLEIRNGFGGIMAESRGRSHRIIVTGIFRIEFNRLLKCIAGFSDEIQVNADEPKIVVEAGV